MTDMDTYEWPDGHRSNSLADWIEHALLPEAHDHARESLRQDWAMNWLFATGDKDAFRPVPSDAILSSLKAEFGTSSVTEVLDLQEQEQEVKIKASSLFQVGRTVGTVNVNLPAIQ